MALVCLATFAYAESASAVLIFADAFEPISPGFNIQLSSWGVTRGSVDAVGNSADASLKYQCTTSTGSCIDINGTTGQAGLMRSVALTTFAGNAYSLSFAVSGSQRGFGGTSATKWNSVSYRVYDANTNTTLASGSVSRDYLTPWQTITTPVTAGNYTSVRIEFDGGTNDTDDVGLLLDDVALDCAGQQCLAADCVGDACEIPEPMTAGLVGGVSLLLLALRVRR